MAGKNYGVKSPIRIKGKLRPVGSKVQLTDEEIDGIEHCLCDPKELEKPEPAPRPDVEPRTRKKGQNAADKGESEGED